MGLLSNLLNDDSGKKAAGSVSDMEKALASDRWITIHPHGFLQGEGEDETKQYYRRIFIDDEGNIEKGIGKGHNIKDLSKAMKKEKEGTEGKTPGKEKGASGLNTLQDKIKAIIDDGTPYNEEKAQKVGAVMLEELEKNPAYQETVDIFDKRSKVQEEINDYNIYQDAELQDARKQMKDWDDRAAKREKETEQDVKELVKLEENYWNLYQNRYERLRQRLEAKYGRDAVRVPAADLSRRMIDVVHQSFGEVINFDSNLNPKDFTRSRVLMPFVKDGVSIFSKDSLETIKSKNVTAITKRGDRSCYFDSKKTVEIGQRDNKVASVTHEFTHALEHANPDIVKLEEEFYNRRTKGEPLRKLSTVTGISQYKPWEVTKVDKFLDPYMGKDYSGVRGGKADAYELLSMGNEYLISKPHKLKQDPDYMKFVLGCLAYRR